MAGNCEKLPSRLPADPSVPDALFFLTDECAVFDHWKQKLFLIKWNLIQKRDPSALSRVYREAENSLAALRAKVGKAPSIRPLAQDGGSAAADGMRSNMSRSEFQAMVAKAKEYIRSGDVIQTVLSQRFEAETDASAFDLYRALRRVNPSPYLFLLRNKRFNHVFRNNGLA